MTGPLSHKRLLQFPTQMTISLINTRLIKLLGFESQADKSRSVIRRAIPQAEDKDRFIIQLPSGAIFTLNLVIIQGV